MRLPTSRLQLAEAATDKELPGTFEQLALRLWNLVEARGIMHLERDAHGGLSAAECWDGEVQVVHDRLGHTLPLVGLCPGALERLLCQLPEFLDQALQRGLVGAAKELVGIGGVLAHGRSDTGLQLDAGLLCTFEATEDDMSNRLCAEATVLPPERLVGQSLEDRHDRRCGCRHGAVAAFDRSSDPGSQLTSAARRNMLLARGQGSGPRPLRELLGCGDSGSGRRGCLAVAAAARPGSLDCGADPLHAGHEKLLLVVHVQALLGRLPGALRCLGGLVFLVVVHEACAGLAALARRSLFTLFYLPVLLRVRALLLRALPALLLLLPLAQQLRLQIRSRWPKSKPWQLAPQLPGFVVGLPDPVFSRLHLLALRPAEGEGERPEMPSASGVLLHQAAVRVSSSRRQDLEAAPLQHVLIVDGIAQKLALAEGLRACADAELAAAGRERVKRRGPLEETPGDA
mmetsp:Transcript_75911/g.226292  ORF Transcript_75911/g.226292 Transcript_75911/m.226292 type:complete len:458 (-) Transcript_75911:89-1462(-)